MKKILLQPLWVGGVMVSDVGCESGDSRSNTNSSVDHTYVDLS